MNFSIKNYLNTHRRVIEDIDVSQIKSAINLIIDTANSGSKIITCGNGGSAATASHYITDWNKMYNLATGKKFRGISLVDNIGLVTAYANDLDYDQVFSGQLSSLLDPGDLVIAISGSGNSKNVLEAVTYARSNGGKTLAVVGYDGGLLKAACDSSVHVKSFDMQICEDFHLMFGHMVMKSLCGDEIHGE